MVFLQVLVVLVFVVTIVGLFLNEKEHRRTMRRIDEVYDIRRRAIDECHRKNMECIRRGEGAKYSYDEALNECPDYPS